MTVTIQQEYGRFFELRSGFAPALFRPATSNFDYVLDSHNHDKRQI